MKNQTTSNWQIKQIKDILDYERPDKYIVEKAQYIDSGTPVLTANKSFILGYTDEESGVYQNVPAIIFDDFTTDSKLVDFPFKVKSSAIKILKEKSKEVDIRFVFERMKSINFPTGSHKRYYISQYQNMKIAVPSLPVQQKISNILSNIDDAIQKTDQIIKKTEELKQGLMQDLLVKGSNDFIYKLDDIANLTSSKRVMVSDYVDQGVPFYRSTEIIKKSKNISLDNLLYITNEKFNFFNKRFGVPQKGDILVTAVGTIGVVYLVKDESFYFKDGNLLWINNIKSSVLPEYLKMLLSSKLYYDILNQIAGGSSQKALTIKKMGIVKVFIPSISEQKGLINILTSIDDKILDNTETLKMLKLLKLGLMHDIFNQKVEVN